MRRGEPDGWDKARVPDWLLDAIREIGHELLQSRLEHRGNLPARFVDKGRTADHYVIARGLLAFVDHRVRSTRGQRREVWEAIWRKIAENAGYGPFANGKI